MCVLFYIRSDRKVIHQPFYLFFLSPTLFPKREALTAEPQTVWKSFSLSPSLVIKRREAEKQTRAWTQKRTSGEPSFPNCTPLTSIGEHHQQVYKIDIKSKFSSCIIAQLLKIKCFCNSSWKVRVQQKFKI